MSNDGENRLLALFILASVGVISIANIFLAVAIRKLQKNMERLCDKAKENLDDAKRIHRKNSSFREALERLARRR